MATITGDQKSRRCTRQVSEEVENVVKDATNPFFKSKYASLENVIETVRPHLAKHGLSFSQFPDGMG